MEHTIALTREKTSQSFYLGDSKAMILLKKVDIIINPYPGNQEWAGIINRSNLFLNVKSTRTNGNEQAQPISIDGRITAEHRQPIVILNKYFPESHYYGNPDNWHIYDDCTVEMSLNQVQGYTISAILIIDTIGNARIAKN